MRARLPWLLLFLGGAALPVLADDAPSAPEAKPAAATDAPTETTDDAEKPDAEKDRKGATEWPTLRDYLRIVRGDDRLPTAMETSIVTFRASGADGAETLLDLVAVVHIGDRAYYDALNERFKDYDAVLYELVAPKDAAVPTGGESDNPLGWLQTAASRGLDLEHQLDRIDYRRENFVHADLTPEEMAETIRKRGDSPWSLAFSVAGEMLREANLKARRAAEEEPRPEENFNPLALLFDSDGPRKMKQALASEMERSGASEFGPTLTKLLIDDRNAAALRVLREQTEKGKRRLALFYGAAHMPDFEQRLVADFGYVRGDSEWLTAWDLDGEE